MVDGVASAAALSQYLPVLESGDDVFDAGPDAAVCPVVVVARPARSGRGVVMLLMPRYALSPRTTWPASSGSTVWRATITSVGLSGRHGPVRSTRRRWAQMMIWVLSLCR
ncbi:hypothetical protein [Mycobacterium sp.]|uniref:hypothetical protein n=1 Tax=Mycobacterium sp. TaxID=1785 RepID=UPI003D6A19E3